jgi:hypothetical protein
MILREYPGNNACSQKRVRVPTLFLFLILITSAQARIGENAIQFENRYGPPHDTAADKSPNALSCLVEGAMHHTYEYEGWKIRAAFLKLNGPAVRMEFSKLANGQSIPIQGCEWRAIAAVNTPLGMSWKKVMDDNQDSSTKGSDHPSEASLADAAGHKMWRRTDGALLSLPSPLIVRLELPAARQYEEQLKMKKDRKARASGPKSKLN